MKFHCDRCKTRYSIADERVRGKILKIRCKNCSAVISVREEMGAQRAPAVADVAKGRRAASVASARTAQPASRLATATKPSALASPAKSSGAEPGPSALAQAPSSALRGAFDSAMERGAPSAALEPSPSDSFRAPDHFDEEWYVSEDGNQSGPFDLAEARAWVGAKKADAELYCWQEDYDDWLAVEKVSHFRGLRSKIAPAALRPFSSQGGALSSPGAVGVAGSKPSSGSEFGVSAREAPDPFDSSEPFDAFAAGAGAGSSLRTGAGDRGPTEADLSAPPANGSAGPQHGARAASDPFPDPFGDVADDLDDGLNLDIGEASRIVNLNMIAPPSGSMADDLDFQAPGAARSLPGERNAADSGGLPGVAKIASSSGIRLPDVRGTGPQVALAPLSSGAVAGAQPAILSPTSPGTRPPSKQRMLIPALIGIAVIATVSGLLIYLQVSGSESDTRLGRSSVGGDELARRTDDPRRIIRIGPDRSSAGGDVAKNSRGSRRNSRNNTNGTARRAPQSNTDSKSGQDTNTSGDLGMKVPGLPGQGDVGPLSPREVINMSRRKSLGTQRCYERALKKDPFLKVEKFKVKMSVEASGVVSGVSFSRYAETFLAKCLAAKIRAWPFRKSAKGLTMTLTMSFEQR